MLEQPLHIFSSSSSMAIIVSISFMFALCLPLLVLFDGVPSATVVLRGRALLCLPSAGVAQKDCCITVMKAVTNREVSLCTYLVHMPLFTVS